MDGDGTTLMGKSCGPTIDSTIVIGGNTMESFLPPTIISTSNVVNVIFTSDLSATLPGWSLSWSAVTPGESQATLGNKNRRNKPLGTMQKSTIELKTIWMSNRMANQMSD